MDTRNFCIIAHIDHGKSTLADRLIEMTGTVAKRDMKAQLLDNLELERERGITIKLQPVRMMYKGVQLNLIDTPGHTDFRYEVSRSLAACEGAILLVDASQGIQAQTLATLSAALESNLTIVPVLNKIDLDAADVPKVRKEVGKLLGVPPDSILAISAKEGTGVEDVLDAVIAKVPAPHKGSGSETRALVFDAVADTYRGVVAYVRVMEGSWKRGDKGYLLGSGKEIEVLEVGSFSPTYQPELSIEGGEIGYIVTGLKNIADARVGDTISSSPDLKPLPGYKALQPMVFAGLYPTDADDLKKLRDALEKLSLNDAALTVEPEQNTALGHGFRCGFLGLLHLDIIQERLEREYDCDLIVTAPSVKYEVVLHAKRPAACVRSSLLKPDEPNVAVISNPSDFPDRTFVTEVREPWVKLEVICPATVLGGVMSLVAERRGRQVGLEYLDSDRALLHFEVPLQGIILDFFDKLKSLSSGYGSMSYEILGFRADDLVKLDILLLGDPVDALSTIVHTSEAHRVGIAICGKLKEVIPKQQFQIPVQAAIGGKIVARETIPALRKDVTGYLYGGDVSRKKKLLEKQKKGKKRLKAFGKVILPQEAFLSILQR